MVEAPDDRRRRPTPLDRLVASWPSTPRHDRRGSPVTCRPMCGIIGVVSARAIVRPAPDAAALCRRRIDDAPRHAARASTPPTGPRRAPCIAAAGASSGRRASSAACPGVRRAARPTAQAAVLIERSRRAAHRAARRGSSRARRGLAPTSSAGELEAVNAALVRRKDAVWAVARDRLRTARRSPALAGADAAVAAIEAFLSVQVALSAHRPARGARPRLRRPALLVRDHGLDLDEPAVAALLAERRPTRCSGSGAVRRTGGAPSFVYKAAAEIGELGDNTARAARRDPRRRAAAPRARRRRRRGRSCSATRAGRASASSPRPTPTRSTTRSSTASDRPLRRRRAQRRRRQLRRPARRRGPARSPPRSPPTPRSSPRSSSRRIAAGADRRRGVPRHGRRVRGLGRASPRHDRRGARRSCCSRCAGAARRCTSAWPRTRSSWPASRTGWSRRPPRYLRMDGETPADPSNPAASRGPGRRARRRRAPARSTASGASPTTARRCRSAADELQRAEITTRDIDRGDFPHFLLKEISEAPASFRKTLRGKLVERDGAPRGRARPGDAARRRARRPARRAHPPRHRDRPGHRRRRRPGLARRRRSDARRRRRSRVEAMPATELSGFRLRDDMGDTLVVAISQSGTTTDTNRTVDLVRGRGAAVIAIVNRRNSDLDRQVRRRALHVRRPRRRDERGVDQGVLRPDRGRVPARGRHRRRAPAADPRRPRAARRRCATLPDAMDGVARHARRRSPSAAQHARAAAALLGGRRQRAEPRSPPTRCGSSSSELCYKSIACDATEDKKHIDLSSEPLILVCAAGLTGSNADDVAKEVAIYRAHKAAPIVIATEGEARFRGRAARDHRARGRTPRSRSCCRRWPATCSATRRRSPSTRRPGRCARRAARSRRRSSAARARRRRCCARLRRDARAASRPRSSTACGPARYDGHLEASTAVRLASLLRYATGIMPLDAYQLEHGKVGTPASSSRTSPTRSPAASRSSPGRSTPSSTRRRRSRSASPAPTRRCCGSPLVRRGAGRRRAARPRSATARCARSPPSTRRSRRSPATPGTASTATRRPSDATIHVVDRGGIAAGLPSRTERDPAPARHQAPRRASSARSPWPGAGATAGTLVIVPETKDNQMTGLTLLHVRFADRLPVAAAAGVLEGYRGRYGALRDAVTETEPTFRDDLLGDVPVVDLLTSRSTSSPTAGASGPGDRPRARPGRARPVPPGAGPHARLRRPRASPPPSGRTATAAGIRPSARGALRRQGGGDEGAGRRPRCRSSCARRRGRAQPTAARRRCVLPAAPQRSPPSRGVRRGSVSLTHTASPSPSPSRVVRGRMIPVVTPEEMAAIDAAAPEPVEVLIERAGAAVAARPVGMLGGTYGRRVVVVAGKGNNGADGRAAARAAAARGASGRGRSTPPTRRRAARADLVIDAAYGTGFHGEYDAPDPGGAPRARGRHPVRRRRRSPASARRGAVRADAHGDVRGAEARALLDAGTGARRARSRSPTSGSTCRGAAVQLVEDGDVARVAAAAPPRRPQVAGRRCWWSAGSAGDDRRAAAGRRRPRCAPAPAYVRLATPGVTGWRARRPSEVVSRALPAEGWAAQACADARTCRAVVVGPGLGTDDATRPALRALRRRAPSRRSSSTPTRSTLLGRDAARARGPTGADGAHAPRRRVRAAVRRDARRRPHRRRARPGRRDRRRRPAQGTDHGRRRARRAGACVTTPATPALATAGTGDVLAGIDRRLPRARLPTRSTAAARRAPTLHGARGPRRPRAGLVAGDLVRPHPRGWLDDGAWRPWRPAWAEVDLGADPRTTSTVLRRLVAPAGCARW